MKKNQIILTFLLLFVLTTFFSCGGGESTGGSSSQKLSVEEVKKMIDVNVEGFEKKLDEKGLYGGPSAMFTRQTDKQRMFVATNVHPEGTTFTDDLATAQGSFDKANGEVKQSQVNGKNVYTQAANVTGLEQYKAIIFQADYRITFGADGKDAAEIKKIVDALVEKVTANLKK